MSEIFFRKAMSVRDDIKFRLCMGDTRKSVAQWIGIHPSTLATWIRNDWIFDPKSEPKTLEDGSMVIESVAQLKRAAKGKCLGWMSPRYGPDGPISPVWCYCRPGKAINILQNCIMAKQTFRLQTRRDSDGKVWPNALQILTAEADGAENAVKNSILTRKK